MDVEAGSKLVERLRWQAFCEQISKLRARRDVHHADVTESNAITHEMEIYLDVLGALMLDQIAREVGGADIVRVDDCGTLWWTLEFVKELA